MAYKGTLGHQCFGDSLFRILTTRWFEGTISMRNLPKFLDLWETTKTKRKWKKKKRKKKAITIHKIYMVQRFAYVYRVAKILLCQRENTEAGNTVSQYISKP